MTDSVPPQWPQVLEYLQSLGLSAYQDTFKAQGYDTLHVVKNLDDEDLDLLGIIKPGHRKLLQRTKVRPPLNPDLFQGKRRLDNKYWERAKASPVRSRSDRTNESGKINDFRILLVRHGESEANVNRSLYTTMPDHAVPLSPAGRAQAIECGKQINSFFQTKMGSTCPPEDWFCRVWTSPYLRARETADLLQQYAGDWISDIRESIFLVEQQFGLFEGKDWYNNGLEGFPQELEYYRKCSLYGGRFWARVPLGESRFDVCSRVYHSFGTLHRDAAVGIKNSIIVSHGVTLRAWMMMWLRLTPEWFEEEKNPNYCSIRYIKGGIDKGCIWPGGSHHNHEDLAQPDLILRRTSDDVQKQI
eukprot:TRINITY_DN14955_c0_g1_i1.p1 TRINITY_DN14955_c0_g1~~TRINITY_DN14955_c0_g1_i1.p1  ORF type:complete len:358 (-),score=56.70 TRINITY_DN14955_c0_g1_i1:85-1158(-)